MNKNKLIKNNDSFTKKEINNILEDSRYNVMKQTESGNYIKIVSDDTFKFYDLSNYYKNGILKMNLKKKIEKYNNIILFLSDSTDISGIKIGDSNFLKNNILSKDSTKINYWNKFNYITSIIYILIILFLLYKLQIYEKKIL